MNALDAEQEKANRIYNAKRLALASSIAIILEQDKEPSRYLPRTGLMSVEEMDKELAAQSPVNPAGFRLTNELLQAGNIKERLRILACQSGKPLVVKEVGNFLVDAGLTQSNKQNIRTSVQSRLAKMPEFTKVGRSRYQLLASTEDLFHITEDFDPEKALLASWQIQNEV